jgi:hypothetical protein
MSYGNTQKDGSGTPYWLLLDADGQLKVNQSTGEGKSAARVAADGDIFAGPAKLLGLVASGIGVTAGNKIDIKDGSGGAVVLTIVFGAANETVVVPLPWPIAFNTAIYADFTLSGGSASVTGIYE